MSLLSAAQLASYRELGHLTVPALLAPQRMDEIIADIERWGEEVLGARPGAQRAWYVDGGVKARTVLRKLDNPHHQREAVRRPASEPRLVNMVEELIANNPLQNDSCSTCHSERSEESAVASNKKQIPRPRASE